MKPLFWISINLIGFIILVFMYNSTDKLGRKNNLGQRLIGYLQIILMFFLVFDTGMYVINGMSFKMAAILHCAVSMLYFIATPLPGLIFLLYCDYKLFNNINDLKKRLKFYIIPAGISVLITLSTPFTKMFFYIDENNIYTRGEYFIIYLIIAFGYLAAYFILLFIPGRKTDLSPKEHDIYLYLFPIPPILFAIVQLIFYGSLLLGIGFVISAYYLYTNSIQSSDDKRKLSVRFNSINIAHFAVVSFVMIVGMFWTLENIINEISQEYNDFNQAKLLLPFLIITILFIIFVFSTNRITKRLIFVPLKLLVDSLLSLKENNKEEIYGLERDDEIGLLSNTIQDLFIKGHYDALTGIYNRRYLEACMHNNFTTLSRMNTHLSVILIDIDFFKLFNDTYGHNKGDECLRDIAQTLKNNIVRKGDFVTRYGGEEFAVILPGAKEKGALAIAGKMLNAIRELNIPHKQNSDGIVTISIGVTSGVVTQTQKWTDYIEKADEALYMSKNNGRNRITFCPLKA